jgi:hypothetical protein
MKILTRPQWILNYAQLWLRFYHLATSPLFLLLLTLILRVIFLNTVECYSYNSNIITIDRANDPDETYFDSWLVHIDHVSSHLGLNLTIIDNAILTGYPEFSPTMGEVYISQNYISSIEWSNLIIRHPEMVHTGYSCILDYFVIEDEGPRNPDETLFDFLYSYCV